MWNGCAVTWGGWIPPVSPIPMSQSCTEGLESRSRKVPAGGRNEMEKKLGDALSQLSPEGSVI